MEIPHTEADIELSSLKVDDLVNSIRASTKIIFLDACRDNPALFKNVVQGRGATATGLAPTDGSHLTRIKPGGGVFIAYATGAGSVALEGKGEHSPFTQALLRNVKKPLSIDDMFSLVTREVALVTKGMQRPYKYASLENIVCLTGNCSPPTSLPTADIVQEARRSESEELQIALKTENLHALEAYLEKYPGSLERQSVLSEIGRLKRSEFNEWTLYEIGNLHNPQFMRLSSIQRFVGRAAVRLRHLVDSSSPAIVNGKSLLDAAYVEETDVFDCTELIAAVAEGTTFNKSGEVLHHYKWADPQYLNLSIGTKVPAGSMWSTARNIVCHEENAAPLVSKKELAELKFQSLSSTVAGDGEIFYKIINGANDVPNQIHVLVILKFDSDRNVKDTLPQTVSIPEPPNYRTEIDHIVVKCDDNKSATYRFELWNVQNELVRVTVVDSAAVNFTDFVKFSPFATLQTIVCQHKYGGIGINVVVDNGSIRVTNVFDGSPADKVGIEPNDEITHIDKEAVRGLTQEEVVGKVRGAVGTKVVLTTLRKGRTSPLELTITRGEIQIQPSQTRPEQ
jgi:hypothetical protein